MKLALSGRLYESNPVSIDELAQVAAATGFQGVELRSMHLSEDSTIDDAHAVARALAANGIGASFVTAKSMGDAEAMKKFMHLLTLADAAGCRTIRVGLGHANVDRDVSWVQDACDAAAENDVVIVTQIHTGGPLETIDGAIDICERVDRPNYGVTYEPANQMLLRAPHGEEPITKLGKHIRNVSVQNLKETSASEGPGFLTFNGVNFVRCLVDDPDGINYASVFRGLKAIGYDGYVTIIDPDTGILPRKDFARDSSTKLSAYL